MAAEENKVQTGKAFGDVATSPVALGLLALFGIGGFIGGLIGAGPAIGAAAAGGVLLLWLLIVGTVAAGRARTEFFTAYAAERKLSWTRKTALPAVTPLLRRGDSRKGDEVLTGALPGGLDGSLALYTYEERHQGTGPNAQDTTEYHRFTIVMANLPESVGHLPKLYCQRRVGFKFLDGAEDVFRTNKRVELESLKLDDRCEIFASPDCDQIWLRRLFSPVFIAYLAEETPKGFAFEIENGALVINVNKHRKSAAELDDLCIHAGKVAGRIREEASQTSPKS